ncbi:hypothetical protein BC834DRAFT_538525 [Gloeopeniophorella convolvens]|nr:hypothetical protein BC834DRAFT_538525 [Gloeopeniophorella convolvens]
MPAQKSGNPSACQKREAEVLMAFQSVVFDVPPTHNTVAPTGASGTTVPANTASVHAFATCPACERSFRRRSECNRHIREAHLPHHIACVLCTWIGSRTYDLKGHWTKHHRGVPGPHCCLMYSPDRYVERIVKAGGIKKCIRRWQQIFDVEIDAVVEACEWVMHGQRDYTPMWVLDKRRGQATI